MKHGNHMGGEGIERKLHDPVEDRLTPLEPLDVSRSRSLDALVRAMAKSAFTGRQLGEDTSARRVGEGGKGGTQSVGRHCIQPMS